MSEAHLQFHLLVFTVAAYGVQAAADAPQIMQIHIFAIAGNSSFPFPATRPAVPAGPTDGTRNDSTRETLILQGYFEKDGRGYVMLDGRVNIGPNSGGSTRPPAHAAYDLGSGGSVRVSEDGGTVAVAMNILETLRLRAGLPFPWAFLMGIRSQI